MSSQHSESYVHLPYNILDIDLFLLNSTLGWIYGRLLDLWWEILPYTDPRLHPPPVNHSTKDTQSTNHIASIDTELYFHSFFFPHTKHLPSRLVDICNALIPPTLPTHWKRWSPLRLYNLIVWLWCHQKSLEFALVVYNIARILDGIYNPIMHRWGCIILYIANIKFVLSSVCKAPLWYFWR